jgi:small subunit ribosomal protein S5
MVKVPLVNGTIPHQVYLKNGSAEVLIKPAPQGTGLKCGGALRVVFELAGIPNAVSKVLNSSNKINIARATLLALSELRAPAAKADKTKAA